MENAEFWGLISGGEDAELECKLAASKVPKEMWHTYSSFANTNGGIILLGVKEVKGNFEPVGADIVKLQKDFWDNINNPNKVSTNILQNNDVTPLEIDGTEILKISVPRAMRQQKPVYIGQNPFMGSYRRNFEGDYRCSQNEVQRMIAEQSSSSQDSQVLSKFDLKDLNADSLKNYRRRFANLKPDNSWNELDNTEFLLRIGGWGRNRKTGEEGLTVAGLLMFGEESYITDYFPFYFLDYRERLSDNPDQRWSNRITSQDGTWSGNLYDFYFNVISKVTSDIDVPFLLEGNEYIRRSETRVHQALREAVLNTIIHANYYGETGVVIEKKKNFFQFSNPGNLRIPLEKAIAGGNSDPRNPILFKMFAQIGLGERSGYGLESIHTTWKREHWKRPVLAEEFQPERTTLTLLPTSLMPDELVKYIEAVLEDRFHLLSPDEVLILVTAYQEDKVNNVRLQELTNKTARDINKLLSDLVEEGLLQSQGTGRGTSYILSEFFDGTSGNNEIEYNKEMNSGNNSDSLGNKTVSSGNNRHSLGNKTMSSGNNSDSLGNKTVSSGNNGHSLGNKAVSSGNNSDSLGNNAEDFGNDDLISRDDIEENKEALIGISRPAREKKRLNKEVLRDIILSLCTNRFLTAAELAYFLERNADGLRKNHIKKLVEMNRLALRYPNTPNHSDQAYKTVNCN